MTTGLREEQIEGLYQWLCKQPDLERAVRDLTSRSLRDLNGYLSRTNEESGIPGLIRGLLICVACDRFMAMSDFENAGGEE